MIDLAKKDNKEFEISSPEDYFKALDFINSQSSFQWNTEEGKRLLKLIEQVNKYDALNFDKLNNKWLR